MLFRSDDARKYYGALKTESEMEVGRKYPGINTIIRPGLIVGPLDKSDRFTYWPVRIDKGAGIMSFLEGVDVDIAMYVGDDTTDLDAFRSLAQLVQDGRLSQAIRVGVHSEEGPEEIVSEADIVVEGTEGVRELLSLLVSG